MPKSTNSNLQIGIVLAAVLAACFAVGYWVFLTYYEYYEEPEYRGYSDRYYNEEWLAADRFLEQQGIETKYFHRVPDFNALSEDETLYGGNVVNLLTRGQTRDLMRWVERGGHLIFAVYNEEESHLKTRLGITFADYDYGYDDEYDYDNESDTASDEPDCKPTVDRHVKQLHENEVDQQGNPVAELPPCVEEKWWSEDQITVINLDNSDSDYSLVLPSTFTLEHSYIYDDEYASEQSLSPFYWAGSNDAGTNFMQFYHGDGQITVTTSDDIWTNGSIAEEDAAHVLGMLVDGKLNVLEHGNVPTLFEILWRYGSELVVATGLLILLWIAHRIRRFGPMLSDSSQTRRSLSDHIAASSAHHWKLKKTERLIHPLQKQLQRAAIKNSPGFGGLTREKQTVALVELSGMSEALCQAAMDVPQTTEPEFVKQVSALKLLIERLNQGQY